MTLLIVLAAALAPGAAAQDRPAPTAAPAPVPQATPALTIDTPIERIADDPRGRAILEREFPGMLAHESYAMFKAMSLKQVQPYSGGRITDEQVARVATALAASR